MVQRAVLQRPDLACCVSATSRGGAEIIVLARQHGPVAFPFGEANERRGVPQPGLPVLTRRGKVASGILADGLQQPVPGPATACFSDHEGLADKPVHHIQRCCLIALAAHGGGRVQPEAARERRQLAETRASFADSSS